MASQCGFLKRLPRMGRFLAVALYLATVASLQMGLVDQLTSAQATLEKARAPLEARGVDMAEYRFRLATLLSRIQSYDPREIPENVWSDTQREVNLEIEADRELIHNSFNAMETVRGAGEVFVRSDDGSPQPVGVYCPKRQTSLVVFLHGRLQTETNIISKSWLHELAERTNAIVIAPYARGILDFTGPAPADVMSAVAAAQRAFHIDAAHTYLAGDSMGGAAVFKIGAAHSDHFSAYLVAIGAMNGSDREAVLAHIKTAKFYLVTGALDDVIPAVAGKATGAWLRRNGARVTYYEQAGAHHSLYEIVPGLGRAWHDMLDGTVREGDDGLGPVLDHQ